MPGLLSNNKKKGWCILTFSCLACDVGGMKEGKFGGFGNSKLIHNVFSQKFVFNAEKIGLSERSPGI